MPDYPTEARHELNGWLSSYGPRIQSMIEEVLQAVDEIDLQDAYPEDQVIEIADSAVPIYTSEVMECAAESAEIFAGPDDRGLLGENATPEEQIKIALYELASGIAHNRLNERQDS